MVLLIAEMLENRLAQDDYVDLELGSPAMFRNVSHEGVELPKDLHEKQELSFYFLKRKAIVIEWAMAAIPQKLSP